ncbi:MAG TPA: hypothetical protein VJV96_10360 [Candidatus Angelobacter sp.]|nr:hypothetical protein [Candidatus Angelobacter sp.]
MRTDLALLVTVVCWLFCGLGPVAALAQAQGQNAFSARDASALLNQINDALVNRSAGKFLAAFDLSRMDNGQLFKQQITSFISHTDSIRVHFNLTSAGVNGNHGVATVDVQMEADTGNGGEPLHKEATLNFMAGQTGAKWKFIDIQPRSFFSTLSTSSGTSYLSQ